MSVLAPPPSPTPSHLDVALSDSDINLEHHHNRPRSHPTHATQGRGRIEMPSKETSSSLKRKPSRQHSSSDAENQRPPADPAAPVKTTPAKRPRTGPTLVEIKDGRLQVKQKPLNWSVTMPVMKAIIDFQTLLTSAGKLDRVPDDQLHVIAKLVQESDRSAVELAKDVRSSLVPEAIAAEAARSLIPEAERPSSTPDESKLTLTVIGNAIEAVAERRNYGLDISHISSTSGLHADELSIPAELQMWRWEVKDDALLPKENIDKILSRRKEREDIRDQVAGLFASLSDLERQTLLKSTDRRKNATVSEENTSSTAAATTSTANASDPIIIHDDGSEADVEDGTSKPQTPSKSRKRTASKEMSQPSTPARTHEGSTPSSSNPKKKERATPKADLTPEKAKEREEKEAAKAEKLRALLAKKAEREAKDAEKQKAKEAKEAELQKKEDLKKKQASFFTSFMQKAQTKSPSRPALTTAPLSKKSDFDKTFLPCQYKDLAPINRFQKPQRELESDRTDLTREQMLADLRSMAKLKASGKPRRKGVHPPVSVREIKRIVTESDVLGGNAEELARKALEDLKDRNKVQLKLLQFESDRRPGWYGTWTKSTNLIGPRCPLGQDPVALDYNYDSDAEWEELGQVDGDDLQDADEKDESAAESDDDSEMDDWLVDDLEVEEEDEALAMGGDDDDIVEVDAQGRPMPPSAFGPSSRELPIGKSPAAAPTTNVLQPKKKKVKLLGRRFDSKLVPFSAGPHWEAVLGKPEYEHFSGYQIEFLNDACFGLDPFTFRSVEIEEKEREAAADAGSEVLKGSVDASASKLPLAGGVLASLWGTAQSDAATPGTAVAPGLAAATVASSGLKHSFPEAEVPALLKAIEGSTKTRAGLVDDLKEHFEPLGKQVSKNALNERIAFYAAKEGKKPGSAWRIKEEFRKLAGL